MLTFEISGAQIDGARDYQEDAFLITHLGDSDSKGGSLVIVADGMGGHAAGNVASNMAVQTFNKHITSNFPSETLSDVLRESVVQANSSISETVRETAALKGMGCTLVAAVMENKFIRWVSVGDSHLYLIRKNELNKKNADHSYGGFLDRMAAEGTPVEPETGFSRNMLMSALTGQDIAEIDCPETPLELEAGDRLIVASDGLDSLSQGKILSLSNDATNPKDCVNALLEGVEEAKMPRQDNTTVIIIDVAEKEDAPTATPELAEVEPAPLAESAPAAAFVVDDEPEKSNTSMIIAIVALVLVLGVGSAYWFTNQSSSPSIDTYVSEDEPFEDEIDSEYEITDDDI
jgi:serine/threonine protein phosphatase PrpC